MKENKTHFIIVRITQLEKEQIIKSAKKANKRLSAFIRFVLGLK